jgi:hypothetical protein
MDEEYIDEDSSHKQSSVVLTLIVDDKEEGIDSELELEVEIKDDDIELELEI